jgi:hypothetical protein
VGRRAEDGQEARRAGSAHDRRAGSGGPRDAAAALPDPSRPMAVRHRRQHPRLRCTVPHRWQEVSALTEFPSCSGLPLT